MQAHERTSAAANPAFAATAPRPLLRRRDPSPHRRTTTAGGADGCARRGRPRPMPTGRFSARAISVAACAACAGSVVSSRTGVRLGFLDRHRDGDGGGSVVRLALRGRYAAGTAAYGASTSANSCGVWKRSAGPWPSASHHGGQLRRDVGRQLFERRGLLVVLAMQLVAECRRGKRHLAGQQVVERAAQAVQVGADVDRVRVAGLLRAQM